MLQRVLVLVMDIFKKINKTIITNRQEYADKIRIGKIVTINM
jgi:hypothetical protein